MSKILVALLASLTLTLSQARENITIFYAWGPGDSVANYHRTIANEANKIQDKYNFVFDTKPGAGNAVAANYVKNNANTILFTSSAFFIRPNLYPNESYNLADFKEIMPFCNGPMAVTSFKYKSWAEVPKDKPLNIGISGLGATSHLISLQIVSKYPDMQPIPFKSPSESMVGMVSGSIDLNVDFISGADTWAKETNKQRVNVLGITGPKVINGYKPLADAGFPGILRSMNLPHHLVVPTSTPDIKFKEWRAILVKAAQAQSVQDAYRVDSCVANVLKDEELAPWYAAQVEQWRRLTAGVKLQ
jgi:tripartite-type tricarboxylate transporter receptor subunit TctC